MLKNPTVDINHRDEKEGVNAFWLAAFYGHGEIMSILAKHGIDLLNRHKITQSNALHIATEKEHANVVKLLIDSGFPINETKQGGFTALIISCMCKFNEDHDHVHQEFNDDNNSMYIPKMLVAAGADINHVTDLGISALSQAIDLHNNKLAEFLLKKGADIFNKEPTQLDQGPLFRAINQNNLTAVELLCDHGADLTVTN